MIRLTFALALSALLWTTDPSEAQTLLNDVEMAHVAVTASNIDIAYAHLALALSQNDDVRAFAEIMIRDHSAVNAQVVALAKALNVTAKDNAVSQQLIRDATSITSELTRLRGAAFDAFYVRNELAYHRAVNTLVADTFIPNSANADVKRAFQSALPIFRGHERHAGQLASRLTPGMGGR
ncbi:MAG: DUF4142 domain-containing protein [Vicinamibacterales bacterium]